MLTKRNFNLNAMDEDVKSNCFAKPPNATQILHTCSL